MMDITLSTSPSRNIYASPHEDSEDFEEVDPIHDIIDYLVRCAKISFKNAHVDEAEVRSRDKIRMAHDLYKQSSINFILQFGKYLAPQHVEYFENLAIANDSEGQKLQKCIKDLKIYHSKDVRHKRIRNRRYRALQKLQDESDYFKEKEMMFRNPLLYEQLVGQFLTDEEIRERDGADSDNLTLLNMILETVDRNEMREKKNQQTVSEDAEIIEEEEKAKDSDDEDAPRSSARWGDFETPDTETSSKPEPRKQVYITAQERRLLHEEFKQEMYSSFIDGRDADIDYSSIDNDEQYDDLELVSQDAEDKYFDSEPTDVENLEEHMKLVEVYGRKNSSDSTTDDTLDVFMEHLNRKHIDC